MPESRANDPANQSPDQAIPNDCAVHPSTPRLARRQPTGNQRTGHQDDPVEININRPYLNPIGHCIRSKNLWFAIVACLPADIDNALDGSDVGKDGDDPQGNDQDVHAES